ncbi:PQQ-binding-like beta-propeller repeat protein [Myxococcota bacterium]|nr:PQQ-binding-like beta-propeller repeat protein [Myxococcota bacterium]MBU1380426.1 PQQ-binding-like beta-propeller repeat protein [Myxococcota bacterium]MBU1498358.1 PQQ-binding-like beta-propeller repeat protein [Myxococcota bacterium]
MKLLIFLLFIMLSCSRNEGQNCPAPPPPEKCPVCEMPVPKRIDPPKPAKVVRPAYNCSLDAVLRSKEAEQHLHGVYNISFEGKPTKIKTSKGFSRITSRPLLYDGFLYFGDHRGIFSCMEVTTKGLKKKWEFKTGDKIWSDAALSTDAKTIYFGSDDDTLYALETLTGKLKWSIKPWECKKTKGANPEKVRCDIDGSIHVDIYGNIFAGGKGIIAVSPDGKELYRFDVDSHVRGGITSDSAGNLFFASLGGGIYSLDKHGKQRWLAGIRGQCDSKPLLAGCLVITGCDDNAVHALRRDDGKLVWKLIADEDFRHSGAFDGEKVYWGGADHYLYAMDLKGKIVWRYRTSGRILNGPSIMKNNDIVFGSEDRHIYCLDADGKLKWNIKLDDIPDTPVVISEKELITGTYGGKILRITK